MLETCRTLGDDPDAIAKTINAWCEPAEKVAIAAGAIRSLSPAAAEALCETALADIRSGPPVAPFDSIMSEAETWAGTASPAELRAYAWASFHALPAESRQRFLAAVYAGAMEAAA